jgi:hypothetical protein
MKTGPLKAQRYETTIDRRKKVVVEAWVRQVAKGPAGKPKWFRAAAIPSKAKGSPILLAMTTKAVPEELKSLVKMHLETGGRAYLLTPPSFDPATELRALTDLEKAQVFIRQLPRSPQVGYCHAEAGIWYTPLGDRAARLHLRLTADQAEEWRHLFLRSFWHEAEKEQHFAKGKWTPAEACWNRPTDISRRDLTCWQAYVDDQSAREQIPQAEIAHCVQANKPGTSSLYTKPDFNAADLLQRASAKGCQIFGLSPHLPECYLQGSTGWLICGEKEPLVLKLSSEQSEEARELLVLSQSQVYLHDRELASLMMDFPAAELLLPAAKDWEPIAEEWPADKAKDLGRTTAWNLQDLTRSELRWDEDDQKLKCPELAMAARFTWEVVPPTAPSKNEDSLYSDWTQHTQACKALKERLVKRSRELSELNFGWHDEFTKFFDDASALKISIAALADFEQAEQGIDPTPKARQELVDHLQAWLEEANNTRKLLNHGFIVQDWLVARANLDNRIKELQAKQAQQTSIPKPSDDAEADTKAAYADQQKERTKLEDELGRLEREMGDKYRTPPSDKSEHPDLKALRPLDKSSLKACPAETLPAVGKLYVGKGPGGQAARFLAITDWAQHDEGLKEAERLKASLVAELS